MTVDNVQKHNNCINIPLPHFLILPNEQVFLFSGGQKQSPAAETVIEMKSKIMDNVQNVNHCINVALSPAFRP
jgi:hypothetical protein